MVTSGYAGQREPHRLLFPPGRNTSHVHYDGNESHSLVYEAQRDISILSVRRHPKPKQEFWLNAPHYRSAPAHSTNAAQFAATVRKSGIRLPYRQVYQTLIESGMSAVPVFRQRYRLHVPKGMYAGHNKTGLEPCAAISTDQCQVAAYEPNVEREDGI